MTQKTAKYSVSFIIPVLNGAKYIGKCLDSIMLEKYTNDEIIIVDNGSTDETLDIARKYDNIQILQFPRVTIAALRNRGTEIAKGDLFAFIDSDCLLGKGWREAVELVMSDASFHATGSIYDTPDDSTWVERAWLSERENIRRTINYLNSGNLVIRKEVFIDIQGFNETLITDEDYDIGVRMTTKGYSILHAPEVRVIHLGNAKTLKEHFERKLWHSTSMLDTAFRGGIDKPFIMTLIFMLSCACFVLFFPVIIKSSINLAAFFLFIMVVPTVTAFYRVAIYKNYKYFFQLVILYLVFYLARSVALIKSIVKIILRGRS